MINLGNPSSWLSKTFPNSSPCPTPLSPASPHQTDLFQPGWSPHFGKGAFLPTVLSHRLSISPSILCSPPLCRGTSLPGPAQASPSRKSSPLTHSPFWVSKGLRAKRSRRDFGTGHTWFASPAQLHFLVKPLHISELCAPSVKCS